MLDIDSRPSDAIALAVRAHVPIWVARPILESVGVSPEDDLQEAGSEEAQSAEPPPPEANEENLSVFEDFFDNLHLDDEDTGNQEENPG
jgi:hypothetical protein